jgi:uncharacterized protein with PIN domain
MISDNSQSQSFFNRRKGRRATTVAFDRYGKDIHSNARLNVADCAAYALAATTRRRGSQVVGVLIVRQRRRSSTKMNR